MRGLSRLSSAIAVCSVVVFAGEAFGQTAASLDVGVAAGGDTNDVQLTYGAALQLIRNARAAAAIEAVYVRDFFEFEPDDPISDALTYSSVTAIMATVRVNALPRLPAQAGFVPYAIVGGGWFRAVSGDTSNSAGYTVGAGIDLLARRRVSLSIEGRRLATFERSMVAPPHGGFALWRLGVATQFRWRP